MTRVSVPLRDELKTEVVEDPEEFGFDDSMSEAQRFAALLEEGAAARRSAQRDVRRADAYALFAADDAHRESTQTLAGLAREHRLI